MAAASPALLVGRPALLSVCDVPLGHAPALSASDRRRAASANAIQDASRGRSRHPRATDQHRWGTSIVPIVPHRPYATGTERRRRDPEATTPSRSSALTFESHLRLSRPHIRSFMPRIDIPTATLRRRRALSVPTYQIGASVAQTLAQRLSSLLQPGWQLASVALAISVSPIDCQCSTAHCAHPGAARRRPPGFSAPGERGARTHGAAPSVPLPRFDRGRRAALACCGRARASWLSHARRRPTVSSCSRRL